MGWVAAAILLLASCRSSKDFLYLQDMKMGLDYPVDNRYEAVIHTDDRLAITVSSKNPELALPFNRQGGNFQLSADGSVQGGGSAESAYRVDAYGYIDFPILGKLRVEGMTVSAATELIKQKIIEGNYIKEPLVSIEFLNFKYTVLGAVGSTGTFRVDGDRITLIEAIARAGDLTSKARIDRIAVYREVNGERKVFYHDLRSKDIFESPAYYLQQNDIVYVEPKYRKKDTEDRSIQYGTLGLSLVTAITSVVWVLRK